MTEKFILEKYNKKVTSIMNNDDKYVYRCMLGKLGNKLNKID